MRRTAVFGAALFAAAFLLFAAQPMVGKQLLPRFGGAAAVWATCLVFFQAVLLLGYLYAHLIGSRLSVRTQVAVQVGLAAVALALLPIAVAPEGGPDDIESPALAVLGALAAAAGLPVFVLAATAPLVQRWFAGSGHPRAADPYFLYAASNAGSLAALVLYPLLIEPQSDLTAQEWAWAGGFVLAAVLTAACGLSVWRSAGRPADPVTPAPPTGADRWGWVWRAFLPSSLLVGATTHITTDLTPVPLLWVVPLGLYLVTFIVAFGRPPAGLLRWAAAALPAVVLLVALAPSLGLGPAAQLPVHLLGLFAAGLVYHGELARLRPPAAHLTEFYLWVAVGGVLGGAFNALAAPLVFDRLIEYPLVLVLAAALAPVRLFGAEFARLNRILPVAVGVFAGLLLAGSESNEPGTVVHRERTFYGVLRVVRSPTGRSQALFHGRIPHGRQPRADDPGVRTLPLTYYHPGGPAGQVFEARDRAGRGRNPFAVVGLGVGTLAAYAPPGSAVTFFEVDPAVIRIAEDPALFQYLSDARARGVDARVVAGDGRAALRRDDARYDLLVLDAFSGDAIPAHLLTREAVELYLDRLAPGGLVLVHVTNAYLNLKPVLGAAARDLGLVARVQREVPPEAEARRGAAESEWVVLARSEPDLGKLATDPRWQPLTADPATPAWTDRYSNVLRAIRWGPE
ncbi:MAG: fused MFS/spermidine synthase [Gemmataceae bacterium]|nr:fused MFS/spermidine synthase [Gemmataceae bacterium]